MTLKRNTFEGGTAGATVTVSNSGTGSGDALGAASASGSGTGVYSTAQKMHGTKSVLVTCTAATDSFTMGFSGMAASTLPGEFYMYMLTPPSLASTQIGQVRAGGPTANLLMGTDSKLRVTDAAGTTLKVFANAIPSNTWYRYYLRCVPGTTSTNGTIEAAYYLGDSTTPAETMYVNNACNAGTGGAGSATNFQFGKINTTVGDITAYFDDAACDDGGPPALALSGVVTPDPKAVGTQLTLTLTASGGNGNALSYSCVWDGTAMGPQASNVFTHIDSAAGTKNWTATVSQAA